MTIREATEKRIRLLRKRLWHYESYLELVNEHLGVVYTPSWTYTIMVDDDASDEWEPA